MSDDVKLCPFKFCSAGYEACVKSKCAWWCEWAKCCAMVGVAAELSDRLDEIRLRNDHPPCRDQGGGGTDKAYRISSCWNSNEFWNGWYGANGR